MIRVTRERVRKLLDTAPGNAKCLTDGLRRLSYERQGCGCQ